MLRRAVSRAGSGAEQARPGGAVSCGRRVRGRRVEESPLPPVMLRLPLAGLAALLRAAVSPLASPCPQGTRSAAAPGGLRRAAPWPPARRPRAVRGAGGRRAGMAPGW